LVMINQLPRVVDGTFFVYPANFRCYCTIRVSGMD
jgi:hypothetical protein